MKGYYGLAMGGVVMVLAIVWGQETSVGPTTEAPPTTLSGVAYGGVCNGALLQCHRYSSTVACTSRKTNETVGGDTCETGAGVNLGRCQCSRNCPIGGVYQENGEFDVERQLCVGFVGKLCSALVPHCIENAACNFTQSKCICQEGFQTDADGNHCVSSPSTQQTMLF